MAARALGAEHGGVSGLSGPRTYKTLVPLFARRSLSVSTLVAAVCAAHRGVAQLDQPVGAVRIVRVDGIPDARQPRPASLYLLQAKACDTRLDLAPVIDAAHDDREFVSSQPRDEIRAARIIPSFLATSLRLRLRPDGRADRSPA